MPGPSSTIVRHTPSMPLCRLTGRFCHCVKSPTSCTLIASGARNEKVCVRPLAPLFVFVFFAISLFLSKGWELRLPAQMQNYARKAGKSNAVADFNRLGLHDSDRATQFHLFNSSLQFFDTTRSTLIS